MNEPATRVLDGSRSALEREITDVWVEVLDIERLDPDADFFGLGGNSLHVVSIIGRLEDRLGLEISPQHLFESPTVAGLANRLELLRANSLPAAAPIPRASVRSGEVRRVPVSSAQRRLWVLDQLQGAGATYSIPFAFEVTGDLDVDVLRQALELVMRRHESLRISFDAGDGEPVQVVAPRVEPPVTVVDLRDRPADEREVLAVEHIVAAARRPFDLRRAPLFRIDVLRLDEQWQVLFLNIHHIITDGRSTEIFFEEMLTTYAAVAAGESAELAELPIQYTDYAAWQRDPEQARIVEEQAGYWRSQLAGPPPPLELPLDRARPPAPTGAGDSVGIELPADLLSGLRELSQRRGSTLFMTMLTAFAILLHRYGGQRDLIIGTPAINRRRRELSRLIGFFVNTLALRIDLSGDPTFPQLQDRVRAAAIGAYAHQEVPFERVVEEVQPDRSTPQPLFQAMLAFQQEPAAPALPGLTFTPLELDTGTARFDLSLIVTERASTMRLALEYSTELFLPETAERMLAHLRMLLASVAANPDARVSQLTLLTSDEQELIQRWGTHPQLPFPADGRLDGLFGQQAARTPDAVAVIEGDDRLTYRELDQRAGALAARLRSLGVGPERTVGLLLPRSTAALVAILGILQAGGAYVPLDPAAPLERLDFIARDAGLTAVVTEPALAGTAELAGLCAVYLDRGGRLAAPADGTAAAPGAEAGPPGASTDHDPAQLAYVMYTSGSTGTPKGVSVTHAQVVPLLHWAVREFRLTPDDRVLHYLSIFFDWSVYEVFLALASGGALVVAAPEVALDPVATVRVVEQQRVTVLHLTPTQMQGVVAIGGAMPTLRYLCLGAEKLPLDLVDRCRALLAPGCQIWNMYGPTECAIVAAAAPLPGGRPAHGVELASAPIGRPVANASCLVLDRYLNPQPVGVAGELWIGGDGVARGYLGQPGRTAQRFGPDPRRPRGRMYRTGDRVRWLPDGQLEFLGRSDHQVKLRGIRIELGEIESALATHPSVAEVAVAVDEVPGVGPRLVAYLVPAPGAAVDRAEVYGYLTQKLPAYLVPSVYLALPAFPRTPTGKIDRAALPRPEPDAAGQTAFTPAGTPTEEAVARVWADALHLDRVDVNTDFFALGGNSLLVVRTVARLRKDLGVEVPMSFMYPGPTVAELANRIDLLRWSLRPRPGGSESTDREEGEL